MLKSIWKNKYFAYYLHLTLIITFVTLADNRMSAQATVDSLRQPTLTKPEKINTDDSTVKITKISGKTKSSNRTSTVIDQVDSAVEKAYSRSLKAYYYALEQKNLSDAAAIDSLKSYNTWALTNRKKVIETQQIYAKVIFILVIIIVLSGVTFSALQFYNGIKHSRKKAPTADTTFKASISGIEISSSILGVIILTLSIVFFYLYLTMVYPVVLVK